MDREHGTEWLADASFLEEFLRGRKTVLLAIGDSKAAQHLGKRLGATAIVVAPDADGKIARPDRSAEAVVALGGFENDRISEIVEEARRILSPEGLFAISWVDPSRPSLEVAPFASATRATVTVAEAQRELSSRFGFVAVVARQPYLGFQYVSEYASGTDSPGELTLDSSLTSGVKELPTGYLALASNGSLPSLGDALIQVPYDLTVARISGWVKAATPTVVTQAPRVAATVGRRREGGEDLERLRSEAVGLRDRAQSAVEESDRARGEARAARERAALLEAEVTKLRSRLVGAPDPALDDLRAEIALRIRERDSARKDAEGAAAEAQRALEAAAHIEREGDFLRERKLELEAEIAGAREERERAARTAAERTEEAGALRAATERATERALTAEGLVEGAAEARAQLEEALAGAERRASDAESAGTEAIAELEEARRLAAEAAVSLAAADLELSQAREANSKKGDVEKRIADLHRRSEQALKRLQDSERRIADLELAKLAAERSAEDAWKRLREAQQSPAEMPPEEWVPAADLEAVQITLATAIGRAEDLEREHRELVESIELRGPSPSRKELDELEQALDGVEGELEAARRRADDAEARADSARLAAEESLAALDRQRSDARLLGDEDQGLKSLLHQRETTLQETKDRSTVAEARAVRFSADAAEAIGRARLAEEALAERDAELGRALSALRGVEEREQIDRELLAELKGEVARLTEALDANKEDLRRASAAPIMAGAPEDVARERDRAVEAAAKAQADAGRAHSDADALRERLDKASDEMIRLLAEVARYEGLVVEKERGISDLESELTQLAATQEGTDHVERRSVIMAQRISVLEAELEGAQNDLKLAAAEARKNRALAEAIDPPADRSVK